MDELDIWRKDAEAGDASAQFWLGIAYANDWGLQQNFSEAARWYRLAADQGYQQAQSALGQAYETGKGVEKNYISSYAWHTLAAAHGNEIIANGSKKSLKALVKKNDSR